MDLRTRARAFRFAASLLAALALVAPLHAETHAHPSGLAPGEFEWHPERATTGPLLIVVSLDDQLAHVYRDGTRIGTTTVSTGRPGLETPTGVFTILERKKIHFSNRYDDAPMPFMQRLTWDGVALHAGVVRARPASHGCIRLPPEFAKKLFDVSYRGATVVVMDAASQATLDLAGLPADMARLVFDRPWPLALPSSWLGRKTASPTTLGGGGVGRTD